METDPTTPDPVAQLMEAFPGSTLITPLDQLLFYVYITACEGGVQYWANVASYHLWLDPANPDSGEDVFGFWADLEEPGYDDELHVDTVAHYRLDRAAMLRGWQLATTTWRDRIRWSSEPPPAMVGEDGWDHDAGDADTVVQLAVLGSVVYG